MSEQTPLPHPDEPSGPSFAGPANAGPANVGPPYTAQPPRRDILPWLCALGFVVLAGGIFYLWQYPKPPQETAENAAAIHALDQRVADVDGRLNRLEQRPTVDVGKLTARMDSLEGKLGDQAKITARMDGLDAKLADQSKITARIDSLDSKLADQAKVANQGAGQVDALSKRIDGIDAKLSDQAQIASRLDTVSGRIESLSGRYQTAIDANKKQLDTLAGRVATQESNASTLSTVTNRLDQVTRLQEAALAFAAGRPIGELPGAPDVLSRFAHAAPPTEAQLRLQFPQAEQAALAAKQPEEKNAPLLNRAWERAQGLVTIRQGDDVVVGNTSSTALSQAKAALDVGDIAGAVNALDTLKGPPGQAMANWLADAKAFLGARAALADMADHV